MILVLFQISCNSNNTISLAEIETMPLIETHCHIDWGADENPNAMNQLIDLQKKEKLTYALWISKDLEKLVKATRENVDIAGAVLWIHPDSTNWNDLDTKIKDNIDVIKGLKLHPTMDNYEVEFERLKPVFELANKYNIFVVTHTDVIKSQAGKFRPLMDAFPETKLILYHVAPQDEACQIVNDFDNVYLDVSYTAWGKEFQQEVLTKVSVDKILFGIDSPLGFKEDENGVLPHYRDAAKEVAAFYNFDREIVETIFYKNSMKLFELSK